MVANFTRYIFLEFEKNHITSIFLSTSERLFLNIPETRASAFMKFYIFRFLLLLFRDRTYYEGFVYLLALFQILKHKGRHKIPFPSTVTGLRIVNLFEIVFDISCFFLSRICLMSSENPFSSFDVLRTLIFQKNTFWLRFL